MLTTFCPSIQRAQSNDRKRSRDGTSAGRFALGPLAGVLLATVLAVGAVNAQTLPDWVAPIAGVEGKAMALDAANNSYAVGNEVNTTSQPISIFGNTFAIVLSKVTPSGALAWRRTAARSSVAHAVVTDHAGGVVVAGSTVDTTRTVDGALVQKYDAAGNLLWEVVKPMQYGRTWLALPDAAGNVYAAEASATQFALTKYSPAGVELWTRFVGARLSSGKALALTAAGHVLAAANDAVVAYDGNGNVVWTKPMSSLSTLAVAAAPSGNVYVFADTLAIRHDGAFNELWRVNLGVTPSDAAIDASGNLVIAGQVSTPPPPPPPGGVSATVMYYDWLTSKVGPAGNVLWQRTFGEPGWTSDSPKSVAVAGDGSVYVSGDASALTTTGTRTSLAATVKYAADGTQQWVAADRLRTLALDVRLGNDGGVYVNSAGSYFASPDLPPQAVSRYGATGLANQSPVAVASVSTSAGPAPLAVTLRSTGSSDPDGLIAGYLWDLGDGRASTEANPSVTYTTPGQYTARLTVTDTVGAASAPAGVTITVNDPALAPKPQSLVLARSRVPQRSGTAATVTVTGNAGVTVRLASSNASAATVPSSVTIPAGATSASFKVTTLRVQRNTAVTLSATANGATVSAPLTVTR